MDRHHAPFRQVVACCSAVLFALACGVDPPSLPPSPFEPARAVPLVLTPEAEQRARLLRRLAVRIGWDARDCGTFPTRRRDSEPASRRERLERALACLQAESMRHGPARLFAQVDAIDTWVAQGLFTKSVGVIWAFDYDADPIDQRAARFRSWSCPEPALRVTSEYGPEFACEPTELP